jgi:hypothetical protein
MNSFCCCSTALAGAAAVARTDRAIRAEKMVFIAAWDTKAFWDELARSAQ